MPWKPFAQAFHAMPVHLDNTSVGTNLPLFAKTAANSVRVALVIFITIISIIIMS